MRGLTSVVLMGLLCLSVGTAWADDLRLAEESEVSEAAPPPALACSLSELIALGMMAKYDDDRDSKLNLPESVEAVPLFTAVIQERLKVKDAPLWMVRAAYTYSLKYKRFSNAVQLVGWLLNPSARYSLDAEALGPGVAAILCAKE